jgi:hypothetical protein
VIDPRGIDVVRWTDEMSISLQRYGNVGRLDDPSLWREWATQANGLSAVRAADPPDPSFFDDWREWAERFNATVFLGA